MYIFVYTPWNNHLFWCAWFYQTWPAPTFTGNNVIEYPGSVFPKYSPIRPMCHIYSIGAWWYKLRVRLQGYPDVPFETCHITRVHDLLILYVGSKSFAEPTAFHHLDEPQGWGYFQHPLRGTNSPQKNTIHHKRTLRWSQFYGKL